MQWIGFDLQSENQQSENVLKKRKVDGNFAVRRCGSSNDPSKTFQTCSDPSPLMNPNSNLVSSLYTSRNYSSFEKMIGYSFKDYNHLLKAFTHISYSGPKFCYER